MFILAFDTTMGFCSVALMEHASGIVVSRTVTEASRQAELLIPTIEMALKQTHTSYQDITSIATTVGPGSFTGVRIGLATAHGLLLATQASFFGVSTLEVTAWLAKKSLPESNHLPLHIVLDARREAVFYQPFDASDLTPLSSAMLCTYEEAAERIILNNGIVVGSGAPLVAKHLSKYSTIEKEAFAPHADAVATLAAFRLTQGQSGLPATPLYIRKPDAKLPSRKFNP